MRAVITLTIIYTMVVGGGAPWFLFRPDLADQGWLDKLLRPIQIFAPDSLSSLALAYTWSISALVIGVALLMFIHRTGQVVSDD